MHKNQNCHYFQERLQPWGSLVADQPADAWRKSETAWLNQILASEAISQELPFENWTLLSGRWNPCI